MDTTTPPAFGARLLAVRKLIGLTQAQAAALIGVPARTYWDWEAGKTAPPEVTQRAVLRILEEQ